MPALVIHGLTDTICDVSGGRATAAAIPGAELVLIDGMGHNLPPGLWERFAVRSPQAGVEGVESKTYFFPPEHDPQGSCARDCMSPVTE